ncbi:uncharacterized protein PFL1_01586 [Pseudozyma flocculosa PF-1]|uniref:BHLH domain-containing protein n=1 Tax=Pseudozyma flocculosa TaxID=84751 RepID=A0A5C3EY03_9BASI|nr:uncharacterized protein PFL1_01586 [Pseudozyma flocculosa PF-1]EPQ30685.1 hypothetical protein PFL1_01586 [Pseudozyma flocculosa PF-1]SPO36982.1 uncharacterized protein PSFLO_02454 [Pseudozyma flocculosa]
MIVTPNDTGVDATAPAASGSRASQPERNGAEKPAASDQETSVSSILAQLNQEQLASIVAAARASEAGRRSEGSGTEGAADSALENLPPGLGQAATALTSIASAFKRNSARGQDAQAGAETERLEDAPPPPGTEQQVVQDGLDDTAAHLDSRLQGATRPPREAVDVKVKAAIASLNSMAAQQGDGSSRRTPGRVTSPSAASPDGASPTGTPGSSGGSNKRMREPDLERARKDNHKEVERRRRSAIADGITQLSQIVPGCDAKNTNKSSIIVAAVNYIQDLKNNEASNIEKWTLEKLLMDQAMGDLHSQLEEVRRDNDRLRQLLDERRWVEDRERDRDRDRHRHVDEAEHEPSDSRSAHHLNGHAGSAVGEDSAVGAGEAEAEGEDDHHRGAAGDKRTFGDMQGEPEHGRRVEDGLEDDAAAKRAKVAA